MRKEVEDAIKNMKGELKFNPNSNVDLGEKKSDSLMSFKLQFMDNPTYLYLQRDDGAIRIRLDKSPPDMSDVATACHKLGDMLKKIMDTYPETKKWLEDAGITFEPNK